MARAPRRAVTAVLAGLVVLLAGCTVGPSQRRRWRCGARTCPRFRDPAPTAADVLPGLQEQNARSPSSPAPPTCSPPRALRSRRAAGRVRGDHRARDPDRPDLGAPCSRGARRRPGAPLEPAPALVRGDTGADPSARHAAVLAGRVSPELLQGYTLVGMDRPARARTCSTAPRTTPAPPLSMSTPRPPARPGWPTCSRRARAWFQSARRPRREPRPLPHRRHGRRRRSAAGRAGVERPVRHRGGHGPRHGRGARAAPAAVGRLVLALRPPHTGDPISPSPAPAPPSPGGAFAVACSARPDGRWARPARRRRRARGPAAHPAAGHRRRPTADGRCRGHRTARRSR